MVTVVEMVVIMLVSQYETQTWKYVANVNLLCYLVCPASCKCVFEISELRVECRLSNLTSVPSGIPDSAREMYVDYLCDLWMCYISAYVLFFEYILLTWTFLVFLNPFFLLHKCQAFAIPNCHECCCLITANMNISCSFLSSVGIIPKSVIWGGHWKQRIRELRKKKKKPSSRFVFPQSMLISEYCNCSLSCTHDTFHSVWASRSIWKWNFTILKSWQSNFRNILWLIRKKTHRDDQLKGMCFHLHSDLSDNRIENVTSSDFWSLGFLQRLLVILQWSFLL